MKLLTHNLLVCNVKGVKNGYPLNLVATEVVEAEADFSPEFLQGMLERMDWERVIGGRKSTGLSTRDPLQEAH